VAHIAILPHVKIWKLQAFSTHFDMLKVAEILYKLVITSIFDAPDLEKKYCQKFN
jgi:hypothetical protein